MALLYSDALKNAMANTGLQNAFGTDARVAFFSGAQPADADLALTGVLGTLVGANPLFAPATGTGDAAGDLTTNAIASANASASGLARSFCIYRAAQTVPTSAATSTDLRIVGTVGSTADATTGDLQFDNANLVSGAPINFGGLTLNWPG